MASGFTVDGIDLDLVLAPWHAGSPAAASTGFEVAGVDFKNRYATLATASAPEITGFVTDGDDLDTIFAAYGATSMIIHRSRRGLGQLGGWRSNGTVTSGTTTCPVEKGKGAIPIRGTSASGSGVLFTAPTSATTAVTGTVPSNSSISGTMYCAISDGTTSSILIRRVVAHQHEPADHGHSLHGEWPGSAPSDSVRDRGILFRRHATLLDQRGTERGGIGLLVPAGDGTAYDIEATLVSGTAPSGRHSIRGLNSQPPPITSAGP